ncbi:MAG: 50S ribosomal protein L9 [Bacteroides sp.]|nr:50S ribosomal protein L9 [Bacteroides sp.]
MKIILKENVVGLGYKDDVVEVKDGYGRNYLIPQGKCIIASDAALKQLKEDLKQRAHKIAALKAEAEAAAKAIEGLKLSIVAKTGANGTVYGSVGPAQIAEALAKLGHEVDRKIISVKQPVKVVGEYVANVKFHKEVETEVAFVVVSEDAAEAPAEAPAAE